MASVSSLRSYRASSSAVGSQARIAFSARCCGSPSRTEALSANVGLCASAISEVRLIPAPVQDAFSYDVVKPDPDEPEVDQHFPESEKSRTGDLRQSAVDDGPRHHENRFHVEEDKQNRYQVETHTEAAPSIPNSLNAAFIRVEFRLGIAVTADEPGSRNHGHTHKNGDANLQKQGQVLPVVWDRVHCRPVWKISERRLRPFP